MVSKLALYEIWTAETRSGMKLEWDMPEFNKAETNSQEIMPGTPNKSRALSTRAAKVRIHWILVPFSQNYLQFTSEETLSVNSTEKKGIFTAD